MNDPTAPGKRLVARTAALQAGAAVLVALPFLAASLAAAQAALAGGLIVAVGNGLFGWRMFGRGPVPAPESARAMYGAEALKWLWTVAALVAALAVAKLPGLPLLTGVIAAHAAFWLGMIINR